MCNHLNNITILSLIIMLTACSVKPQVPVNQLADSDLCAEYGYAAATGDTSRLADVVQEGKNRDARKIFSIDEDTCETLVNAGVNKAQLEMVEAERQRQAWAAIGQMGQQMQQQAQQQSYQNQILLNQQMSTMQQNQALNNVANAIRGY